MRIQKSKSDSTLREGCGCLLLAVVGVISPLALYRMTNEVHSILHPQSGFNRRVLSGISVPIFFVSPTVRQGMNSLSHSESPLKED